MNENITDRLLRLKYYLLAGIPLIFFFILLRILGVSFIGLLYFFVGYVWNFALLTPGLSTKVNIRKYRYSFLKLVYKINELIFDKFYNKSKWAKAPILRSISPFMFILILWICFQTGNVLFVILGSVAFELVIFLSRSFFRLKV